MIREGARAALWQARELIFGALLALIGLWTANQGGYLLVPVGAAIAIGGAAFGLLGWRRMRFSMGTDAPGVVQVDEAQITYMGPQLGGFISLSDLIEIRLVSLRGRKLWRLKQSDGQALLIPLNAAGAEELFDAFASLPGLSSGSLVAALDDPAVKGPALVTQTGDGQSQVIWQRGAKGIVPR